MTLVQADIVNGIFDPAQIRPARRAVIEPATGDLSAVTAEHGTVRGAARMLVRRVYAVSQAE